MSESLLVALLSLLGTLAGTLGGVLVSNRLIQYRLDILEQKVDRHNALIEQMGDAQRRLDAVGEQLCAARRRLEEPDRYDM